MGKKILVVDDSASVRQLSKFTLKHQGYDIVEAENGQLGLNKAKSDSIDMIISDLYMPQMNGIQLVGEVRKLSKYKFIPIVLLTTESSKEKKMMAKKAGATGWIVKPFKPDKLIKIVKRVLR